MMKNDSIYAPSKVLAILSCQLQLFGYSYLISIMWCGNITIKVIFWLIFNTLSICVRSIFHTEVWTGFWQAVWNEGSKKNLHALHQNLLVHAYRLHVNSCLNCNSCVEANSESCNNGMVMKIAWPTTFPAWWSHVTQNINSYASLMHWISQAIALL